MIASDGQRTYRPAYLEVAQMSSVHLVEHLEHVFARIVVA
jgi:hypothetical protein